MSESFYILAALTVSGMAAAMTLRNIVHCVLALTFGFVGLAALYLQLGAQFVGFTQIIVYVGAVAILAVFVIMMTHRPGQKEPVVSAMQWGAGAVTAMIVFAVLAIGVRSNPVSSQPLPKPDISVSQIGDMLMRHYVLPLEIIGLLLTAALIGAVILAMDQKRGQP